MNGARLWTNMCTRCGEAPALIETWGYDYHSVFCLLCAADDLADEMEFALQSDLGGLEWKQRKQAVLDLYAGLIMHALGGVP